MARTENPQMSLNKMSLADAIAARTGLARSVAYEAAESLFDIVAETVAKGGSVSVTNFGSFSRTEKRPRMARNPQTGDPIQVPARRGVKFSVAPRLCAYANSDSPESATIRKGTRVPVSS